MTSSTSMVAGFNRSIVIGLLAIGLLGCKPDASPPDLLKTQREALEKAKALEGQLQQQLQDRMSAAGNAQK